MAARVQICDRTIIGEVEINRAPEDVFRTLTQPNLVLKWWGSPDVYSVEDFQMDLAAGGHWSLRAIDKEGDTFSVTGRVLRCEPPALLEFTWNPSWAEMPETIVRFQLTATQGKTFLRVCHEGFRHDTAGLETHRYGWPLVIDWLAAWLAQPNQENVHGD